MGMRFRKPLSFASFAFIVSLLSGCGVWTNDGQAGKGMKVDGREVSLGERFKLIPDEKVSVKDTALTIQLKSVRRSWRVDGKSETADADIIITLGTQEQRTWVDIGEKVTIGDYVVELWGADPFGKTACELIVARR
mgnify:CR=1 FL=1